MEKHGTALNARSREGPCSCLWCQVSCALLSKLRKVSVGHHVRDDIVSTNSGLLMLSGKRYFE